jgi:hypothetical protein
MKQRCPNTDENWLEIQKEKALEKLERKRVAKGQTGTKPVRREASVPTPKGTTTAKPAPPPVAGPSKPKMVDQTPAMVPTSVDDSDDIPLMYKVKGKQVEKGKGKPVPKPAPSVLSLGSDGEVTAPVPRQKKVSLRGTKRSPDPSLY